MCALARPYPQNLGVQNLVLPVFLQDAKQEVPTQESITTKDEESRAKYRGDIKVQNFKTMTCPDTIFPRLLTGRVHVKSPREERLLSTDKNPSRENLLRRQKAISL